MLLLFNWLRWPAILFSCLTLLTPTCCFAAEESPPKGSPVYLIFGRLVIFYPGVEKPEEGYKSLVGAPALAVIKKEGKIIGEIVGAPLKEAPEAEAKSMAASAEKGDKIKLHKQETLQQKSGSVEVVTMRMELDGKFGKPWYFHSVYFPQKEASVTFKLITSENEFAELLPIFEKMLNIKRDEAKND